MKFPISVIPVAAFEMASTGTPVPRYWYGQPVFYVPALTGKLGAKLTPPSVE